MRNRFTQQTLITLTALLIAPLLCGCQSLTRPGSGKGIFRGLRPGQSGNRSIDPDETLDPLGERNPDRILLDDLSPGQIGTTWQTVTRRKASPDEAQQIYQRAQSAFLDATNEKNANPDSSEFHSMFEAAANDFRLAASRWPDSSVEEDALFYEGESYFFANRYVQSNRAFEKLISLYSGTRYLDKAEARRFAVAQYWLELAKQYKGPSLNDPKRPRVNLTGEAERILHRIRLDDPTGVLADDATIALANAYFEAGRFQEAGDTFEDLRRNYPGSEHQYFAHLFELKSRLNTYEGPEYDDSPLRQADELMRLIVAQFPAEANEQKQFLATEATNIRNQLAQRDLTIANYFEGRGENRAAQIYYQEVNDQYQDTTLANGIEEQIAALNEKPPEPPQRAQWLVDFFPENKIEKPVITAGDERIIR